MYSELEILADDKILFEGIVYTKDSIHLSTLVYQEAVRQGDKDMSWVLSDNIKDRLFNKSRLLFLPTDSGTEDRRNMIIKTKEFRERLMIMKSAISDERIPSSVVRYGCDECEYDDGNADIYLWEEHFGRDWILDQVRKYHFTPALSEVKKVILEGLCPYLKTKAIETIISLGGKEAADTLVQKLEDKNELMLIRDAAATGLIKFNYASSVPSLIKTFEETIYTSPWELYSGERGLLGGGDRNNDFGFGYEINKKIMNSDWLPMICLSALSKIPTLDAITTLEKATKINLENTSEHARYCISDWIDTNFKYLKKEFALTNNINF